MADVDGIGGVIEQTGHGRPEVAGWVWVVEFLTAGEIAQRDGRKARAEAREPVQLARDRDEGLGGLVRQILFSPPHGDFGGVTGEWHRYAKEVWSAFVEFT